ncbi:MAG TPA: M56 family metallopeptidase, partial [Gemmataceae bacterium]|nr:M56 family metallopeptidase [Gemmataceae bacterium]
MSTLLATGLMNVIMATALALCAAVVGRFIRKPALTHSLWVLVLLKLVTPPLLPVSCLPSSWSWGKPEPAPGVEPTPPPAPQPAVMVVQAPAPRAVPDDPPRPSGSNFTALKDGAKGKSGPNGKLPPPVPVLVPGRPAAKVAPAEESVPSEPVTFVAAAPAPEPAPALAPPIPPAAKPVRLEELAPLLGTFWLLGSLGWFVLALRRIWAFQRLLRYGRPAPEGMQRLARELAERMGLRRCPEVRLVPGPLAPMVWAAGGPARILFPVQLLDRLDEEGVATLLAHELAHLRRLDHWVRWLELLTFGLYWWCPLLLWVRRRLRVAEEECCDAWVVGEMPAAANRYARALLETVDFLSVARPALPAVASGVGEVEDIKRRLLMIVRGATPRTLSLRGRLAVLALFLLLPLFPA